MDSGSKSRVWVQFPGFGYQKIRVLGDFDFPTTTTSLLMSSGRKSRVWVPFLAFGSGTKTIGFSPGFRVFGYPNPSLLEDEISVEEKLVPKSMAQRVSDFCARFLSAMEG